VISLFQQNLTRDSIQAIINEAYERDQAPRRMIDSLMRMGIVDGDKFLPAITQQKKADSINMAVVPPIIDLIIKRQLFDLDANTYRNCWTIIQHAPDSIQLKYDGFIKQLVLKRLISNESYMAYVDRTNVRQSKAQIYGWQFKRFSNGLIVQFPILNGFESEWKNLGVEYNESNLLPDEYHVHDYRICIDSTQFVVLGIITYANTDKIPDDISLSINGKETIAHDISGYFKTIIRKSDLPISVNVSIGSISNQFEIERDNLDYIFLNCIVERNIIKIIKE
jgi:hypothetical protein